MDSYFVTIENPDTFKVGEKAIFKGSAGLKVDRIELVVDGYSLGEVGFGRPGPESKQWQLEYVFNGAGKARKLQALVEVKASDGQIIQNRAQEIDVVAVADPRPGAKPAGKFPVKIVESKVRHTTQGHMDCEGLIVHYTAGRQSTDPSGTVAMANSPDHAPYAYWVMAADGIIYKTHEVERWGYHCGTYHHRTHLGIEIMCPGKLTKFEGRYYPWFDLDRSGNPKGPCWPDDDVRYFEGNGIQTRGYYAKYTVKQETALVGLVQYLKDNCRNFRIDAVVGHDEILPDYKDDPGGSLSMPMADFREHLKKVIV